MEQPQDFWEELFQCMVYKQIPKVDELRAAIATVEEKADISVRRHLAFGEANKRIRHFSGNDGKEYIGELNSDNKLHGRGILIT